METTRKFPRTMREAWPDDRRHAYSVEIYKRPFLRLGEALFCVLVAAIVAAVLLHGLDALII